MQISFHVTNVCLQRTFPFSKLFLTQNAKFMHSLRRM